MVSKRTQKIIIKYLIKQASSSELDELENWIKDPINEKEFLNYVKTNYAIEHNVKEFNPDKVKTKIKQLIQEEKRFLRITKIKSYSKYAAIFIGLLVSIYIFKNDQFKSPGKEKLAPTIVNTIQPGTDKAILTLEDGSVVSLAKGDSIQTQNANSNGEEIIYKSNNSNSGEIAYNYLTIPRGGQFYIQLSDETKVWLNSESQLKYPVSFKRGETRQVELVYGEAYFDVSPSSDHNGAKFKVFNQSQEVEVIGTEFNVKAYKDESNVYTTLVEGKVAIKNDLGIKNLLPSQQSNFDINRREMTIAIVDVHNVTAWKHGVFSFIDMPLKDIMKVLSRWYDVEVVFVNEKLESLQFVGTLNKNQSIDEILSIMTSTTINGYEIKDKMITIK